MELLHCLSRSLKPTSPSPTSPLALAGYTGYVEGVMQLATVDSYSSKWVEVEPT